MALCWLFSLCHAVLVVVQPAHQQKRINFRLCNKNGSAKFGAHNFLYWFDRQKRERNFI